MEVDRGRTGHCGVFLELGGGWGLEEGGGRGDRGIPVMSRDRNSPKAHVDLIKNCCRIILVYIFIFPSRGGKGRELRTVVIFHPAVDKITKFPFQKNFAII